MVMFKEDEQRIREMERQERIAKRGKIGIWLRRLFKTGLALGAALLVGLYFLAALGGDSPALKKGIEDYLTQSSGYQAVIGTFGHMKFFPDLSLDARDITFRKTDEDPPVITIEKLVFKVGFFDLMLSRKRLKSINIEKLHIDPGVIDIHGLDLEYLKLAEDAPAAREDHEPAVPSDTGALMVAGRYGDQQISGRFSMGLSRDEVTGKAVFVVPLVNDLSLQFGALDLAAKISEAGGGGMQVDILSLSLGDAAISGTITAKNIMSGKRIVADLAAGDSTIAADLKIHGRKIRGSMTAPVLAREDWMIVESLRAFIAGLPLVGAPNLIDFYGWDVVIDAAIVSMTAGGREIAGQILVPVSLKMQELQIGEVTGNLGAAGKLAMRMRLDAGSLPAQLTASGLADGLDLAEIFAAAATGVEKIEDSQEISHLDVKDRHDGLPVSFSFDLRSEGRAYRDLPAGLEGRFEAFVRPGNLDPAGLAVLSPESADISLPVDCALAVLPIASGTGALLLAAEGPHFSLYGDGQIAFASATFDMAFDIFGKQAQDFRVKNSLRLSGSFSAPVSKSAPPLSAQAYQARRAGMTDAIALSLRDAIDEAACAPYLRETPSLDTP